MKENIIINYLLLEQILRVTGTYKNICEEYEFLPEVFKQAKTGDINSLFQDDNAKDMALGIIENLTGVPTKFWSGQKRIKLGIRCSNSSLVNNANHRIDVINLKNDDGTMYTVVMNNPLSLKYEEFYLKAVGKYKEEVKDEVEDEDEVLEQENILKSLYSLRGLLTILLINMEDAETVELIDKANIYKHKKWKDYIRNSSKPTKDNIIYSPKYVEIRKGLVQTIIKNLLGLGYVFTFRDLEKEINI